MTSEDKVKVQKDGQVPNVALAVAQIFGKKYLHTYE